MLHFHHIHMPHLRRSVWITLMGVLCFAAFLSLLWVGQADTPLGEWLQMGFMIAAPAFFFAFYHFDK